MGSSSEVVISSDDKNDHGVSSFTGDSQIRQSEGAVQTVDPLTPASAFLDQHKDEDKTEVPPLVLKSHPVDHHMNPSSPLPAGDEKPIDVIKRGEPAQLTGDLLDADHGSRPGSSTGNSKLKELEREVGAHQRLSSNPVAGERIAEPVEVTRASFHGGKRSEDVLYLLPQRARSSKADSKSIRLSYQD